MNNPFAWLAILLVGVGGGAYYYYWRSSIVEAPPPVAAAAPAPAPAPLEPPRILHPVPDPLPGAAPLPTVADSDGLVVDTLGSLVGRDAFARFFVPDGIVRRFVATVDNLPRKTLAQRVLPVKPVPGAFVVAGRDDTLAIGGDNALRYRPYVAILEAAEAKRLVAAYLRFYPLFQTAYQELGYPNGYFNDRLVQAIDDMLAAPDIAAPRLVQPKVLYLYADADLEERSAGQKIMLRMGTANAARVKDKLRAIRRELTGPLTPH